MAEIVKAIALLCQLNIGNTSIDYASKLQRECQVQLASCVKNSLTTPDVALLSCVSERR